MAPPRFYQTALLPLLASALSLGALYALADAHPDAGDLRVRWTIRIALLYWFASVWLRTGSASRWCFSFGLWWYLVHLAAAFHYAHGWSHEAAVAAVERASGFGAGIWMSHLFTLVWVAECVRWWRAGPTSLPDRPGRWVEGFMMFVVFNGTVVYETGTARWMGAAMFGLLAVRWAVRGLRGRMRYWV